MRAFVLRLCSVFCTVCILLTLCACKDEEASNNVSSDLGAVSSEGATSASQTALMLQTLPSIFNTVSPTIKWSGLEEGCSVRILVETSNGKTTVYEKSGITGDSHTISGALKDNTSYIFKVYYTKDGVENVMPGITKSGRRIKIDTSSTSSSSTNNTTRATTMKEIISKINKSSDYLIVCVGDSITFGTGASSDDTTYTAVFAKGLADKFKDREILRYDGEKDGSTFPINIGNYAGPKVIQSGSNGKITVVRSGIGGNTVQRLINRIDSFTGTPVNNKEPDLFIIKSGINDALYYTDPDNFFRRVEPDVYYNNLKTLVNKISAKNPNADIIFMTPTVNDDGVNTKSQLDIYSEKMKTLANELGIPVIDLHKLWMDHLVVGAANYGQGDWLTGNSGDKCHPSDKGHAAIANEMIRAMFE